MTTVVEQDLSDALHTVIGAMRAIERAHRLIELGMPAEAYLLLGRALRADAGEVAWSEVGTDGDA
jgi:hypothetical protein